MLLNEIRQASKLADAYHLQVIRDHQLRYVGAVGSAVPQTFEEIKTAWLSEKKYPVSSEGCDFTIYELPEGNMRFRLVHDFYHHAYNLGLSAMEEALLGMTHARLAREWAINNGVPSKQADNLSAVLLADTVGQAAVHDLTGKFVVNQLAFVTMLLEACDINHLCSRAASVTALCRLREVISTNQPIQLLELQS